MSTQPTKQPLSVPELQAKVEDLEIKVQLLLDHAAATDEARAAIVKELRFRWAQGRGR